MALKFKSLGVCAAALLVAACGGGSTGGGTGSFSDLQRQLADADRYIENNPATPVRNMPTSGGADYSGFVNVLELSAQNEGTLAFQAIGSLDLRANFTRGTVSGTGRDFYQYQDPNAQTPRSAGPIAGSLAVSGTINQGLVEGDINGRLTRRNGVAAVYDLDLLGTFSGQGANGLVGFGFGTADRGNNRVNDAAVVFVAR